MRSVSLIAIITGYVSWFFMLLPLNFRSITRSIPGGFYSDGLV